LRLKASRNFSCCIAWLNSNIGLGSCADCRRSFWLGFNCCRCCRTGRWCHSGGSGGSNCLHGGRNLRQGGRLRRRWFAECRWVKQHGVVAHNAPGRPTGLQNHIDKGVVNSPVATEANVGAPIRSLLQGGTQARHGGVVIESGGNKRFGARHSGF